MPLHPPTLTPELMLPFLGQCPLFQGLGVQDRREIAGRAWQRSVHPREALFIAGRPAAALYVLHAGRVKLSVPEPEGREMVVRLLGPGDLCGWPSVLTEKVYPASARAVEPCRALAWDRAYVEEVFARCPDLARNALRLMAGSLREMQERCRELANERVPQRLARTLLRLVRSSGRPPEEGPTSDVPLSRAELAQMAGTSLFTVSRLLSEWEGMGIVTARRGRVLVARPDLLGQIADEGAPAPVASPLG